MKLERKRKSMKKGRQIAAFLITLAVVAFAAGFDTVHAAPFYPGTISYSVNRWDTLYLIAGKYGITVQSIMLANSLKSDLLMPGQVLRIPANTPVYKISYKVAWGDSLYLISRKFGVTVASIAGANGLKSSAIDAGSTLVIPMIQYKPLKTVLQETGIGLENAVDEIIIDKSEHIISVVNNGIWLKSYHAEFGDGGLGDKQRAGDHKTPEGVFYIAQRSVLNPADQFLGTRWMRVSYPNAEDAQRGLRQGMIDKAAYDSIINAVNKGEIPPQNTALGGGVGIHGGSTSDKGSSWTWGCIGLTNIDVEDFYDYTSVGTKIVIKY